MQYIIVAFMGALLGLLAFYIISNPARKSDEVESLTAYQELFTEIPSSTISRSPGLGFGSYIHFCISMRKRNNIKRKQRSKQ